MIKYLEDLRFVIGLFFAILSCLLVTLGLVDPSTYPDGLRLNLWAGTAMGIFASLMLALSVAFPLETTP